MKIIPITFLALVLLVALGTNIAVAKSVANEDHVLNEFKLFKEKFNKVYKSQDEEAERLATFRDNLKAINEHNEQGRSWKLGVNEFTDLTDDQFKSNLGYANIYKNADAVSPAATVTDRGMMTKARAAEKNWLKEGAVSAEVWAQGGCGSCWAFSSAAMIESYAYINNGTMIRLSPQHLVSCVPNTLQCGGDGGCRGSVPQLAFTYVSLFGITSSKVYPYSMHDSNSGAECTYTATSAVARVRGWELLPRNNYDAVMDHLEKVGPLAVAVDASGWRLYNGGVFEGCDYEQNIKINHSVQLVGYGTDPNLGDYWLVRNSWGPGFGEGGYIRLRRESNVQCGYDNTPLVGSGCKNDIWDASGKPQHVCGQCGILFDVVYPIGTYLV